MSGTNGGGVEMQIDELGILLTGHTFEDFPVFHRGKDADRVLANWTALWHPALVSLARRMPAWFRVDQPPASDRPRILLLPFAHDVANLDELRNSVESAGGKLIVDCESRDEIAQQAIPELAADNAWDEQLVRNFYALGFAYMQIRLLTRHMRYASQMSEDAFADNVVSAAVAAAEGRREQADTLLQSCFDLLSQERDHYYAVDVYLLDLVLVAETLLGPALEQQLQSPDKVNLLLPASVLPSLAQHEPILSALRSGLEAKRIGLVGGEYRELPTSLLASETIQHQIECGLAEFQATLGQRPRVFGRRTFGLAPSLPQLLLRMDFQGAIHATFDGGRFPEATQAKSRWEGDGQYSIDAITRAPLDGTDAHTFLNIASRLSESMDMDHIATRCFVHPAGQESPWLAELRRVTRFTHALGRFVTVDEYFRDTYDPGIHDRFDANQYRSPYLTAQVLEGDEAPLSKWPRYWRQWLALESWQSACTLRLLIEDNDQNRAASEQAAERVRTFALDPLANTRDADWTNLLESARPTMLGLARDLTGSDATLVDEDSGRTAAGFAAINPLGFPRRVHLATGDLVPTVEPPVYAVDPSQPQQTRVVLDAPALGMAALAAPSTRSKPARKPPPPLAENHVLRNEFFEAQIDPETGGLRGLRSYQSRTNRISQQLAVRWPERTAGPRPEAEYSRMQADAVNLVRANTVEGCIETTGRLLGKSGETLATFSQQYTVRRGSRVLELAVHLDPQVDFEADPWQHYAAARFAWSNEAAELSRSLNGVRQTATKKQIEAPLYLEIDDGDQRTAILTGGLPYHVRSGPRLVDTLLHVRGESARDFQLGIAVDSKQAVREASALLAPAWIVALDRPARQSSTWLFHLDARNVVTQQWLPVWSELNDAGPSRVVGVRVRMIEAEGRPSQPTLRSFRPLQAARKIDGQGQTVDTFEPQGDQVSFRVSPHEFVELELLFQDPHAS